MALSAGWCAAALRQPCLSPVFYAAPLPSCIAAHMPVAPPTSEKSTQWDCRILPYIQACASWKVPPLDGHRSSAAEVCWHAQLSSTVSNGLGFASYETGLSMYRKIYEGTSPGPAERGVIAGGAAVTVMAAIQPLEVCCRRMQASTETS